MRPKCSIRWNHFPRIRTVRSNSSITGRSAGSGWLRPGARRSGEAFALATRGEMRLHLADCHLEAARLSLATGDHATAREAWETAKAMIEEMGYHRRDGEVAEIEAQLNAAGE